MRRGYLLATAVFGAPVSVTALPQSLAAGTTAKNQVVEVGIYINQIHSLSLKDNGFEVDFTIWFRGHRDDFDPLGSFEVVSGQVQSQNAVTKSKVAARNYATCRVVARITQFWDVSRFPLDDH